MYVSTAPTKFLIMSSEGDKYVVHMLNDIGGRRLVFERKSRGR